MNSTTATWLDLALVPRVDREHFDLKIHSVAADCGECFVLSLAGRLVRAGDGRLTVFRSREAVERFLTLLEIDWPEEGEHAGWLPQSKCGEHCLRICGSSLCACNHDADARSDAGARSAQFSPRARRSARSSSAVIA